MAYSLSEIIVLFFTYSFVGWLWEIFYCSIKDHQLAYRGFLFGPYCPVYGFAVTTILITTQPVLHNLILLFIVSIVVASIFKYVASLFWEKVFHMKLWDYSHLKGNIQGRVMGNRRRSFASRIDKQLQQRQLSWTSGGCKEHSPVENS